MRTLLFIRELIKRERINYYYNSLKGTENLSVNELRNIQKDRLLELLRYIKNKNSFYSRFLTESGEKLNESSSNPFSILQHLPVIDKSFIKDHYSDWENSDHSLKSRQVTSGSTGVPFVFFSSTVSNSIKIACKTRFLAWHGVKRGRSKSVIWG